MKKNYIFVLVVLLSNLTFADSIVLNDVKDLNQVNKHILLDKPADGTTLVVLDIDDTLLESVNFIGSGKWYNWQRGKVVFDSNGKPLQIADKNKFLCMHSTLGTLFELGMMKLTQKDAAQVVNELKNNDLMILTSRTTHYRGGTERELKINGIDLADKHLLDQDISLAFNFDDGHRAAQITYHNGIVMSSGLNKGLVLKEILRKIGKNYESIYFIDDSRTNVETMRDEWKDSDSTVKIFHYTKVDKSISQEEIEQSIEAKKYFDGFLKTGFPDRSKVFVSEQCR